MGRLIFHSSFFPLNLEGPQIENDQLSESFPLSLNASFFKMRGVPSTGLGGEREEMGGLDPETSAEPGRREAPLGSPRPALVACSVLYGPGAQGRDPSYLTPAFAHKARVRVSKAALQTDSVGDSTSIKILLPPGTFHMPHLRLPQPKG